jgi:hypothetical protein
VKDRTAREQYAPDKRGKISDPTHPRDPACVGNGGADIVDQLLFDQLFAIPDAVEHFSDRNRRDGMLANQRKHA